jgi:hypothetical protein
MLELAAKAAGYTLKLGEVHIVGDDEVDCTDMHYVVSGQPDEADWYWSPLEDDGDALRLAVKLRISVNQWSNGISTTHGPTNREFPEDWGSDPCSATRRAIVRAAAEIGRSMP